MSDEIPGTDEPKKSTAVGGKVDPFVMLRFINLPADKIHDPSYAYGRLITPWFGRDRWGKRKWLALYEGKIKLSGHNGFHNCRATGVH